MNVLMVSVFPPDPAPEANHALHLSEQLAKAGHTVQVLCEKGSIASTHHGIEVRPVINDWSWSDLPRLAKCLKSCKPDVVLLLYIGWVYNHNPMITFLPTICKTILGGVPCVTQFEIVDTESPRQSFGSRVLRKAMALWAGEKDMHWMFGTLLRDSARTIVLSSPHRDRLMKHDSEIGEKSVIIPPSPLIRFCQDQPAATRQQVRDAIGATEKDFVLIYWGYIYPGKGIETLLQAFRLVCRQHENLRLVLVGGNLERPHHPCSHYFQMVHRLPETLGIADKVTWTGYFNWDSDAGSRYLRAGDACVLPFDYGVTLNNSSLAAASTHGMPVISTELSDGQDEALEHGKNIYLCRPRDPEMLADAIQLILDDINLRERLRLGALDLAQDWYRWETTTQRLEAVLESAISDNNAVVPETSSHTLAKDTRESDKGKIKANSSSFNGKGDSVDEWSPLHHGTHAAESSPTPLVSVIVAVHNVEKYLSHCLDALVNQTLRNIEIIVVNDASTDQSAKIIDRYKSCYENIKVIACASNKGLASARNIGMRAAKGRYIAFADGDDWVDIRMCEVLYQRASEHNASVVIADATVFYEDSKNFRQFFDQHVRKTLDPRLRTVPFELSTEPRALLLEPVAWTKLYDRAFLENSAIQFEDGMNSYEDICFHFSVILKAPRISLLDDKLFFYRQNRPGQISGRKSRKVFEVFAVFKKIHENLSAWEVSPTIWAMLIKVQVRQFDWLLRDRVQAHYKREFLALVAKQFQKIPEDGFRNFTRQANLDELLKLFCMRRNWFHAYEKVTRHRRSLFPLLYVMLHDRQLGLLGILKGGCLHGLGMVRRRMISFCRSFLKRSLGLIPLEIKLQEVEDGMNQLIDIMECTSQREQPLVEPRRIGNQTLFLSYPSSRSGLSDAVRRMEDDYYLTQMAVFRRGDTVLDIGAHVGVVSIYLARKYPFIKVYAVEPDPLNYGCLKRNIELNGVTNVTAINKAVSGDGQKQTLYVNAWESAWATIDARMTSSQLALRTVQVETVTLEQLFQEFDIRHCRLMKITATGAIHESLKGFMRRGCVDLLCGEVDFQECSRARLEMASWSIARQYFWRTTDQQNQETPRPWVHQTPSRIERSKNVLNLQSAPRL